VISDFLLKNETHNNSPLIIYQINKNVFPFSYTERNTVNQIMTNWQILKLKK